MLNNKSDTLPIVLIVMVVALTTILFVMWRDNELEDKVGQSVTNEVTDSSQKIVQIKSTISQTAPTDGDMGVQPVGATLLVGSQSAVFNAIEIETGVNNDLLKLRSDEKLANEAGARILNVEPGASSLSLLEDEDTLCPVTRWADGFLIDEQVICTRVSFQTEPVILDLSTRASYFSQKIYCTVDVNDCDSFNLEEALSPESVEHDHSD